MNFDSSLSLSRNHRAAVLHSLTRHCAQQRVRVELFILFMIELYVLELALNTSRSSN